MKLGIAAFLLCAATLSAQMPLRKERSDLHAHVALAALDRDLETWNSRDPKRWATSLHFPFALTGSDITYIVTNHHVRWGVLSRFAADPSGLDATAAAASAAAARKAVDTYFAALNRHDVAAFASALHPHVRIADAKVELSRTEADFLAGSEPGRLRTWFETRLDRVEIVQAAANGVNVAVSYSRRDRTGRIMSS